MTFAIGDECFQTVAGHCFYPDVGSATGVGMGQAEWLSMSLLAIAILIGSVGAAIAYQNGPPAMVGTFDFAYVGFAVLWSIIFFADIPDAISVLGMVLIVAAGILSLRQ
jgi:drug/metabolite transporter (DMT)-like permease